MAKSNVLVMKTGDKTQIRMSLDTFNNKQYFNIRTWVNIKGEWKPTGKGISVLADKAADLLDNINTAADKLGI